MHWRELSGTVVCLGLLTWGVSWAGALGEPLPESTVEWGIMTGYGLSNTVGPSKPGIDFFTVMPRFGYVLTVHSAHPAVEGQPGGCRRGGSSAVGL
jgi:hypothetical protein